MLYPEKKHIIDNIVILKDIEQFIMNHKDQDDFQQRIVKDKIEELVKHKLHKQVTSMMGANKRIFFSKSISNS